MDEYSIVDQLPSQFKPYPEGVEISYRPLQFREVAVITNLYQRSGALEGQVSESVQNTITRDIIRKIQDAKVVKVAGMNFMDLTLGDWLFVYLCVMSESHMDVVYKINVPCSSCNGILPDAKVSLKTFASADVTPGMIEFDSVEDEVEMPVLLDTDAEEEIEIDFLRLRHYLARLKDPNVNEIDLLVTPKDANLSIMDVTNINFVREMMSHLPEETVNAVCASCQNEMSVAVKWSEFALTVKSPDEQSRRSRIHFGKRSQPTVDKSVPDEVSGRDPLVRKSDRPRKKG